MSNDIQAEVARVGSALATPMLKLLDRKSASIAVPIFMVVFSDGSEVMPTERFHHRVDALLDELRAEGYPHVPSQPAKTLAAQWVRERWLYRDPGRGEETYRLTGDAEQALEHINRATRTGLNVSASRIETMRQVIAQAALAVHPDRAERMRRISEEIARLQAEYERLEAGGELCTASDAELLEQFSNVLRELDGLPVDFLRVEESVRDIHKRLMREFREESRPIGEVIDDYLAASQHLLDATPEGCAFVGALELYRTRDWLDRLRTDLATINQHPVADELSPDERRRLANAVDVIRSGMSRVLDQRRRATATLREYIENYDHIRNRELEEVLRSIDSELRAWMKTARARDHIPVSVLPAPLELESLKLATWDPDSEQPPEDLEDVSDQIDDSLSLEEIRRQGGPTLDELRAQIDQAIAGGEWPGVADLFNRMPVDLRRPVEALGILHLLAAMDADFDLDHRSVVDTVRPDGSTRRFLLPDATFAQTSGDPHE